MILNKYLSLATLLLIYINISVASGRPATIQPATDRIVAIGDVHGDYNAALEAIRLTRIIDNKNKWIGGNTTLVQVGDQTDRGDSEKEIIDYLEILKVQANKVG